MGILVEVSALRAWSYAYSGTRRPIIREVRLTNRGDIVPTDIEVFPRIRLEFPLQESVAETWEGSTRILQSRGTQVGQPIVWDKIPLRVNPAITGRLLEHVEGRVVVEVIEKKSGNLIASGSAGITLLPSNIFLWEYMSHDSLAAFVLPSDPFVAEILARARQLLQASTGSSATEGYQYDDAAGRREPVPLEKTRVRQIANAIFDAIKSFEISYSNPPAALLKVGQRVRTPSQIKSERCATCLDSTVLFAACLEQAGISSALFLIPGHAFVGYFTGRNFPENSATPTLWGKKAVNFFLDQARQATNSGTLRGDDDRQLITAFMRNCHIQPVETTNLAYDAPQTFNESCQIQNNFIVSSNVEVIESVVIPSLAWKSGITPPVLLAERGPSGPGVVEAQTANDSKSFESDEMLPPKQLNIVELDESDTKTPPRVRQWKSSLLDLSAKNPLLKVKAKTLKIDFPTLLLGNLDDLLFTPKTKIQISSLAGVPTDWIQTGVSDNEYETWIRRELKLLYPSYRHIPQLHRNIEELAKDILEQGVEHSEVLAYQLAYNLEMQQQERKLAKAMSSLQSAAKEKFLQSGVNPLYVALGSVAWEEQTSTFKGQRKTTQWLAPLYLYPIIIEGGRGSPFTIRLDTQGEVTPNYCLHEKLRRLDIDVPELIQPLEDQYGIDFDRMFESITARLQQNKKTNFAVRPDVHIGVFDFATFRLWMDLNEHWEEMAQVSPVARHLMLTPNQLFTDQPQSDSQQLKALTPIPADDSQREAIELALNGTSFRLEGPPGTGKSQTITNLLASCLAYKKKILFVAEKQTALDAVKKRLDACGLGDFCLNLHAKGDSDTRLRKNITEAITTSQEKEVNPEDEKWENLRFAMENEERLLDGYKDALHSSNGSIESLWQINELMLEVGDGQVVDLPHDFVSEFFERWTLFRSAMQRISEALDITGDPRAHRWRWVASIKTNEDSLEKLTSVLSSLLKAYQSLNASSASTVAALEHIQPQQLAVVSRYVDLQEMGWVPDVERVAQLRYSTLTTYKEALASGETGERSALSLINDCRTLHEDLHVISESLDPAIATTREFNEALGKLLFLDRAFDEQAELGLLLTKWTALQLDVSKGGSVIHRELLRVGDAAKLRDSLQKLSDSEQLKEVQVLRADCTRLQSEVQQHATNVNLEFLSRGDLVNIDLLLGDLEAANVFNRSKRSRSLRDFLGDAALTTDDRALQLSVKFLRQSATTAQEIVLRAKAAFASIVPAGWRPWNPSDCEGLWQAIDSGRIEALRSELRAPDLPAAIQDVQNVLTETLAVLDRVPACRESSFAAALGINLKQFNPWEEGESDRLRNEIVTNTIQDIRQLLGAAVRTSNDDILRKSIRHLSRSSPKIAELLTQVRDYLLPGHSREIRLWLAEDVNHLESAARASGELHQLLKDPSVSTAVIELLKGGSQQSDLTVIRQIAIGWSELSSILEIDTHYFAEWRTRGTAQSVLAEFPSLLRDAGPNHSYVELRRMMMLRVRLDDLRAIGLHQIADQILYQAVAVEEMIQNVRRSALTYSFRRFLTESNLDRFDRRIHEKRIATFEAALKESQRLLKVRIPGLVSRRQRSRGTLSGRDAGATQSLLRGLKPGRGDRTPIRDLIAKYGKALSDSLPCFLMSPDSVARLLPVGAVDFDLIVFDEASQVKVPHAIGAIGRGKACVVVGDSKQMPPSTSFSSNQGVYIEDDQEDSDDVDDLDPVQDSDDQSTSEIDLSSIWESAEDMESILKEFEQSGFPFRQLLCHYRSKDEVLIAFSNSEMYDKPMITFPSIYGDESLAIKYVHLPDGRFERDRTAPNYVLGDESEFPALRTNRVEAEAVVDEVLSRLRDPARRARWIKDKSGEAESIIVVTFNIQQMKLITLLLETSDPALFAEATQEGEADELTGARRQARLKIRNLENVQGDEADTVMFSIAFTKTPQGKFPLNWGPVTQPQGDRRLNVAVTRARYEMVVYCSFLPDEMMVGRNRDELGIETQRVFRFLQIAHDGPARLKNLAIATRPSRHIEQIAEEIRQRGYRVRVQEGLSKLRVDIAVARKDRDYSELAILVDDDSWKDRGSAFQREILPRQVLPGLGWKKVIRIWLPAWVNEREAILSEIDNFFTELERNPTMSASEESQDELLEEAIERLEERPPIEDTETAEPDAHYPFEPYEPIVIGIPEWLEEATKTRSAKNRLLVLIQEIINKESPIEITRLGRHVGNALGLSRVTTDRIEQIRRQVPSEQRQKDAVGEFCWARGQDPDGWMSFRTSLDGTERSRKIEEISTREVGNALVDLLHRVHSVDKDAAIRELANIFGFKAVSEKTADVLEKSIKSALMKGRVRLSEGELRLPE